MNPSAPLLVISLVFLHAPAAAQTVFAHRANVLIASQDPLPGGLAGELVIVDESSTRYCIGAEGRFALRCDLAGIFREETVLLYGTSRDDMAMITRSGLLEPSGTVANARVAPNLSAGGISPFFQVSDSGALLFTLRYVNVPGSIELSNDSALYLRRPGSVRLLAREGGPVLGADPGALYMNDFGNLFPAQFALNGSDSVAFAARVGTPLGTTREAICAMTRGGNVRLVMQQDQFVTGGFRISSPIDRFPIYLNANGSFVHKVLLYGNGLTNQALWIHDDPGINPRFLAREGDAAPFPGTFFGSGREGALSDEWTLESSDAAFNAAGQLAAWTRLRGSVTVDFDDSAIVRFSEQGHQAIARTRDPAPGAAAGERFFQLVPNTIGIDDAGRVLFLARLEGPSVTQANDIGLWSGAPGDLRLIAREGSPVPGAPGTTIVELSPIPMSSSEGTVLFVISYSGGPPGAGSALLSWRPDRGIRWLGASGDPLIVRPGYAQQASRFFVSQNRSAEGDRCSIGNDGEVITLLDLADQNRVVVGLRDDSLSSFPPRLSVFSGNRRQKLFVDAGAAGAARPYLVLGSMSGTSPGIALGASILPLNPDDFLLLTVASANQGSLIDTFGILDARGRAKAEIFVPIDLPFAGVRFDWSCVWFDAAGNVAGVGSSAGLELYD